MDRILRAVFSTVTLVVNLLLLFMVVMVTSQVLLRGLTGASIKWGEEAVLIAMVWVTFLTMALGVRADLHMRIDMFMARLSRPARGGLEFCLNLFLALIFLAMVYYGFMLTRFGMASTMPATRLPTAYVYLVVPITGLLCFIQLTARLFGWTHSDIARRFIDGEAAAGEEGGGHDAIA